MGKIPRYLVALLIQDTFPACSTMSFAPEELSVISQLVLSSCFCLFPEHNYRVAAPHSLSRHTRLARGCPPSWMVGVARPRGGARIPGSLQAAEGVDEKEVSGPDRFRLNSPKLRHGRYPESLLSGAQREAIEQSSQHPGHSKAPNLHKDTSQAEPAWPTLWFGIERPWA